MPKTRTRSEESSDTVRPLPDRGLCIVALFEGAKGALVLLTGFGILALIHKDLHQVAVQLVQHMRLNPSSHYPKIFIELANRTTDLQLWFFAAAAICYALIRFVEAWGPWRQQQWAEWFGLLTGGMYIPVELYEVIRVASWPRVTILAINLTIVGYLLIVVWRARQATVEPIE